MRAQDLVWLLLFSALAIVSPRRSPAELEMLAALAILQLAAPRIEALSTERGRAIVVALKLLLGFLLIGVTGGILSSYYLILLLPVLSAATTVGPAGTALTTSIACIAYLSFLPLAFWFGFDIDVELLRDVSLRVLFLPVVAYLTYQLARDNREQAARARATAAELVETNRRLLEAEASARRAERLAALGQLTAGLAHELRNPMGTIKASAEMLLDRLAPTKTNDELSQELAGYISSEVDRANLLITRFLEFARPTQLRRAPTDLNHLADQAIEHLVRQQPGCAGAIHKNYDPSIPTIDADSELLERVVFNLLRNAFDASPQGAMVTVRTRAASGIVEIAVLDRGEGIPPEHREQIFNPFFTTKPTGVGLGLAISAKIIDEHSGAIEVDSEPGRGSAFRVQLPHSPAQSL
jgi:two-component system, NtrC family, sensor histidine kinase HydH